MRRLLLIAMFVLLASSVAIAQEREVVFRDLAWGDPLGVLGNATLMEDSDGLLFYARANEELSIGSLQAKSIMYGFFDDQLTMLIIVIENPKGARRVLEARFGRPYRDNEFMLDAAWLSGDTLVILKESFGTSDGLWTMGSRSLYGDYEAWLAEQAAKDAASF